MKCPYRTITTQETKKDKPDYFYYREKVEYSECIGEECPFFYTLEERRNMRSGYREYMHCKRAEKEGGGT